MSRAFEHAFGGRLSVRLQDAIGVFGVCHRRAFGVQGDPAPAAPRAADSSDMLTRVPSRTPRRNRHWDGSVRSPCCTATPRSGTEWPGTTLPPCSLPAPAQLCHAALRCTVRCHATARLPLRLPGTALTVQDNLAHQRHGPRVAPLQGKRDARTRSACAEGECVRAPCTSHATIGSARPFRCWNKPCW